MSINIEYNSKENNKLIITHILKMLERRKLITNWEESLNLLEDNWVNNIYEILLSDKSIYSVYLLNNTNTQLTSISSGTQLYDYLSNNIDIHKIVIIRNPSKKAVKQIFLEYKNAEFFFESDMQEDIANKVFSSEHEILSDEYKAELLSKFNEKDLARILLFDKMARYYNAKVGDIFRIKRPSHTCGNNIFYRRVVNSSIDILF